MVIENIQIGKEELGEGRRPLIVAEMSGNHNQSLTKALALVDAAAAAGCRAIKLQTYTADTMTIDVQSEDFLIQNENSLWKGRNLYDLYKQAHTPWEWHATIFERCKNLGLEVFSTPFDESAVDFLESLNVPAYKIASFENTHLPLIRRVAATGKPIIISTGMASVGELAEAVSTIREAGNSRIILLRCTSAYPSTPKDAHLRTIPHLRDLFQTHVGLSDHTAGIGVALASIPLGVVLIEKHFTIARADGGPDAAFSMEPAEMEALVVESERAFDALGMIRYGCLEGERASLMFRQSIYVVKDIAPGEVFSRDNIRIIRPGFGLAPKYFDEVLRKTARVAISRGTALSWDMVGG